MTVDGYLSYFGIKEGYFCTPDLLHWLRSTLLRLLRADGRPRVIVLDNASAHVDEAIAAYRRFGGRPRKSGLAPVALLALGRSTVAQRAQRAQNR